MSSSNPSDTEDMSLLRTPPLVDAPGPASGFRTWCDRWLNWMVEARSHRVICLILGIWLINGFDLALTLFSHEQGMLDEANPVARRMLEQGTLPLILYKIGLVLIGSYPLLKFRAARITELGTIVILIVYATLAVQWSNCYDLYHACYWNDITLAEINALIPTPG